MTSKTKEPLPAVQLTPILTRQQESIAVCASGVTFLAGLNSGWFGAVLPSLALAQNIPLASAGTLVSASSAGALTSLILSNLLIRRLGDYKAILLSIALTGAGFFGLAFLSGLFILVACSFCVGLGFGLNGIVSHILFPRYFPQRVASALSRLNVFYGVGALVGPMIALALFSIHAPYSWIFSAAGLYTIGTSALLWRAAGLAEPNQTNPEIAGQAVAAGVATQGSNAESKATYLLRHPLLLALTAINFLYVGLECSLGTWIYTFLQRADGLNATQASTGMTLLWTGLTLGRVASTRACLKYDPKYITVSAMLILTGAIFALASWQSGWIGVLALVLTIGFGLGPIFPTVIAQSAMRFPAATGLTTTLIISAGYVGGIILPWWGGNLLAGAGSNPVHSMLAAGLVALLMPVFMALTFLSSPAGGRLRGSRLDGVAALTDSKD